MYLYAVFSSILCQPYNDKMYLNLLNSSPSIPIYIIPIPFLFDFWLSLRVIYVYTYPFLSSFSGTLYHIIVLAINIVRIITKSHIHPVRRRRIYEKFFIFVKKYLFMKIILGYYSLAQRGFCNRS